MPLNFSSSLTHISSFIAKLSLSSNSSLFSFSSLISCSTYSLSSFTSFFTSFFSIFPAKNKIYFRLATDMSTSSFLPPSTFPSSFLLSLPLSIDLSLPWTGIILLGNFRFTLSLSLVSLSWLYRQAIPLGHRPRRKNLHSALSRKSLSYNRLSPSPFLPHSLSRSFSLTRSPFRSFLLVNSLSRSVGSGLLFLLLSFLSLSFLNRNSASLFIISLVSNCLCLSRSLSRSLSCSAGSGTILRGDSTLECSGTSFLCESSQFGRRHPQRPCRKSLHIFTSSVVILIAVVLVIF